MNTCIKINDSQNKLNHKEMQNIKLNAYHQKLSAKKSIYAYKLDLPAPDTYAGF